jgi:hypothetical protein
LKDVYCDANAIDDVIHQFENNVSLREKTFYSDQICAFYATFFQIVQQSEMRYVVENFDYVQQQHHRYFFTDSDRVDDFHYVMQNVFRDNVFSIFEKSFE